MRKLYYYLLPFALTGLIAGCAAEEGRIEARQVTQYTIEDFLGTTSIFGSSFSPDKTKILVSSDETGVYNAFAIPVDGSEPIQLTESTTDAVMAYSYFPEDERFIYGSDQGGNELTHIYVRELDGSSTDLTPGEGLKASFLGWAQDDRSFFISTNERDNRFFDIYEISLDGFDRTLIYQDETGYQFADISPDKRYLAFAKPETTTDSDIYLYDRETGEMEHLTPHDGEIAYQPVNFSPDGSSLYILTDEDDEFSYLVRHDLETGERAVVEKTDWDVWYKYMVVGINNDASTEIKVYDAETMDRVRLPEFPAGDITSVGFSRDEDVMALYVSSSRNPRDLFFYDMAGDDEPKQLTTSLNPNVDSYDLVDGEVVRFASYDGVEIPGILYRPHQVSPEAKAPALVWVHGGPGGQSRIGYSGLIQYLVNHGYVVYAINNRGSNGYGKTFYKMDDRQHGESDLADCVASKEMLVATGYVDPDRIGIIGGSYGGYMVLAALTLAPDEFAVGVDLFGISNWIRTLESIPPWWESFREALYTELGDPAEDRDRLHRISPLFNAANITQPLMVLQGANDPRVLQVESDEIVEAARTNGVPVEYIVFEDEGHGFMKKENQLEGYKAILEFLNKYLMAETETIAE
jgi:dipeptidyl aminopeptidase/acylaminoacyl peptidase